MMMSSAQLDQPREAVVAVDDAAIEIVEIGRGEAPAVSGTTAADPADHRVAGSSTRTVAGLLERLDDLGLAASSWHRIGLPISARRSDCILLSRARSACRGSLPRRSWR
jgi:hypothetical protein